MWIFGTPPSGAKAIGDESIMTQDEMHLWKMENAVGVRGTLTVMSRVSCFHV